MKILLVEDDRDIVKNLTYLLQNEGYNVFAVSGQRAAEKAMAEQTFAILLLDVSLDDGNGFAVCTMAKRLADIPVIFLTASGDELSVVTGLDIGADDYISKPFRPMELVSRIKNVLRRYNGSSVMSFCGLSVDTVRGTVHKDGKELFLSALEYRLLLMFANNRGAILTRSQLLEGIWDVAGEFVNDNTLTVYIKRLREKIESDPQNPIIIETVRGMGYRLSAN